MTAADVNVPELVARAIRETDYIGCSCCAQSEGLDYSRDDPRADGVARLALAALRSPEVVAGIAGVLVHEQSSALCDYGKVCDLCDCFADRDGGRQRDRYALDQARAVVDWLTGGAR